MFLTARPFGHDWARAARTVADVVTVAVVRNPSEARHRWESIYGPGAVDRWVRSVRVRPAGRFSAFNAEATARRVESCLRSIERDRGPIDILHGHFYAGSAFLPAVTRRHGTPYVITEHSTRLTGESAAHKRLSKPGFRIATRVFNQAARVIAVSEYLRSCIRSLGLPGDLEVIGNPVDVSLFRPPEERSPKRVVVSVGRLDSDKDPKLMLDAFARARSEIPDLRLEMIGDGPDRSRVTERAAGFSGHVRIDAALPRQAVAERLQAAGVFALGSRVETFCVAAAEAIASGVPVVMPDIGPMRELVDDSNGILVRDRDPVSMANAMVRALKGGFDPQRMAAGIASRFSYEAVGARLSRVYSSALGSGA